MPTIKEVADTCLDPTLLAADLREVVHLYEDFFAHVDASSWDRPVGRRGGEWTVHETIAHLDALNGAGVASIVGALEGETYTFDGLETRYQLDAYNRQGVDDRLGVSAEALRADFVRLHTAAADLAATLSPEHEHLTMAMPIYNRPVRIVEALGIIVMHAGLVHTAQVAEPAGLAPLWMRLAPEIRHRQIGRVMRAFSLLYRHDIGDPLRAVLAFHVGGAGGGDWHVDVAPKATTSAEGVADHATLRLRFRETDDFCRMLTQRMNVPMAVLSGRLRLRGDLRLFLRMGRLFSVDARP
jgi:hypothetical protein